ncbi:hypothetical protein BD560DRAFT_348756 [Blakeslea trispora]|nr:hypothetical protein BD560DRAFT_348756 [Blakeslea trispora]
MSQISHSNISIKAKNISVNFGSKRERSTSPATSNSTVSTAEVKRSRKVRYFLGKGSKSWTPEEELMLGDVNITKMLKKFRNLSISEADKTGSINSLRVLQVALSHVFPINEFDADLCITKYFGEKEADALKEVAAGFKPKIGRAPAKALILCKKIADGEDEEDEEDEEGDEANCQMMHAIKDLALGEKNCRALAAQNSEATFIDKHLTPVIKRVLLDGSLRGHTYAIADKAVEGGLKPDFMIGVLKKKKKHLFFFVEVKRPNIQSKYQPEEDMVKLLKHMKSSIDDQLHAGINDCMSFGLLVEGYRATLMKMTLPCPGIYMPVAIKRFSLVGEIHQLVLLPSVVEAFWFVKCELHKFQAKVLAKASNKEKERTRKMICPSFITKFEAKK